MSPNPLAFANRIIRRAKQPSTNDANQIELLDITGSNPLMNTAEHITLAYPAA